MEPAREGGCLCGAVRYRAQGNPARTVVCHCRFCQRHTGSAFGVWPTYAPEKVELRGTLSTYEHRSGEVAILGGTFDDTGWITVDRHVWTRSRQHWVPASAGVASFEKSSSG